MARIGVNPARGKSSDYRPAKVTLAVLCYIPNLDGYFKRRLDVLKLSLSSLYTHTPQPFDLLVFDNGSCPPVVDYLRGLHADGVIDYLTLSASNIGKIGAFKLLFKTAPGEIVAYSDDDIFFYPGWLDAHLQILESFPNVGMISGIPLRDRSERASNSLQTLVKQGAPGVTVTIERRVPDEWETDWAISVGRDPQKHLAETQEHKETVLKSHGVEAIGTASHFQFVAPRQAILDALPENWSGRLMGEMIELDESVDKHGYLRLATAGRYVRHMGNTLSPDIIAEAKGLQLEIANSIKPHNYKRSKHWLLLIPGARRILRIVFDRIFNILNRGTTP